ncbi:MAG: MFS transporter [Paracoccaceae bacterium]
MISRQISITILILAQISVLSVWFSSAAVLAEMKVEAGLTTTDLAWLTTSVQLGFSLGALGFAALGLADRFDPRRVFCLSALVAALANLGQLWVPIGGTEALALRALTGAALAGVYPVGMKIAVGWSIKDRGLLVGALVGALTLGSASPHLIALIGGADWRVTIWTTTLITIIGGLAMLWTGLGPHHARAPGLNLGAIRLAWTDRRIRYAILGYLGHMWELYIFWAWIGVIAGGSYALAGSGEASWLAKLTAFLAVGLGGVACVICGRWADRFGKAQVAAWILGLSTIASLMASVMYGGPVWLVMATLIMWGMLVVPDSPLFSALVADAAPPERAGSLMTLQTSIGFLLTAVTVQATPLVAGAIGWPIVLGLMGVGPALGLLAMRALIRITPVSN